MYENGKPLRSTKLVSGTTQCQNLPRRNVQAKRNLRLYLLFCVRAGKPPVGLHLDVLKGDKLIQKLMIDEKKCYLFGRNAQMNDFSIDHASCSRVHAALVYHKHLDRAFLVDLGSSKCRPMVSTPTLKLPSYDRYFVFKVNSFSSTRYFHRIVETRSVQTHAAADRFRIPFRCVDKKLYY